MDGKPLGTPWDELEQMECRCKLLHHAGEFRTSQDHVLNASSTTWKAGYDNDALWFGIYCMEPNMEAVCDHTIDRKLVSPWSTRCVEVQIEPRRLWPCQKFTVSVNGGCGHVKLGDRDLYHWQASTHNTHEGWSVTIRIPFKCLDERGGTPKAMRINILRIIPSADGTYEKMHFFVPPQHHGMKGGSDNFSKLAWLLFI